MLAKDRMVVILSERIAEDSCCYLRPSAFVIGPLPKVEVKLDADGQIMVKGPTVFKEYYKRP